MTAEISMIGQGQLGKALAKHFEKSGISVQVLGRGAEPVEGKFVIFAVPYEDMVSLIYPNQDHFANKIIIDISNPLDYQTKASLFPPGQSASLKLAELFPHLSIIKAFNTNLSSNRLESADQALILMAGDHPLAKEKLALLLKRAGFTSLDLGGLERSPDLEAFARVQFALLEAGQMESLQTFAL